MKFFTTLSLAALASGHALPRVEEQLHERDFQSVTLVFQAAAASYNMTIPADGQEYFTSAFPHDESFPPSGLLFLSYTQ